MVLTTGSMSKFVTVRYEKVYSKCYNNAKYSFHPNTHSLLLLKGECGYGPNVVKDGRILNNIKDRDAVLKVLSDSQD